MTTAEFSKAVLQMRDRDLKVRHELIDRKELFNGYHPEMEAVHVKHASIIEDHIDSHGWPNFQEIGKGSFLAMMMLIQHAISLPDFQIRCLEHLQKIEDPSPDEK